MELDDLAVAQYLRADPRFFERNLRLLDEIVLPDPHGGAAISLVERQQAALRERARNLEMKLSELVKFGEENDVISERVHRLAVALMGVKEFDALVGTMMEGLRDDFLVPHVTLRLWGLPLPDVDPARLEFSPVEPEFQSWADGLASPYCGHRPGLDVAHWFGETPVTLRSFALVPLRQGKTIGLLAMGSEDERRFYPEMGTLYLKRIGELLSQALGRLG